MITVACVYWKGAFRGRERVYDVSWVEKLRNMVARNLTISHRFVCLSNVGVPCERIPLIKDWPGWWSKIELFRPGLFPDRVLYLDLDLVVLKDLRPFIDIVSYFTILGKPRAYTKQGKDGLEVIRYNSSVMSFYPGAGSELYTEFEESVIQTYRGDQDYIGARMPELATFSIEWVKKLRDCPDGKPTPEMKIMLCMPGKNERIAKQHKWVKELWI